MCTCPRFNDLENLSSSFVCVFLFRDILGECQETKMSEISPAACEVAIFFMFPPLIFGKINLTAIFINEFKFNVIFLSPSSSPRGPRPPCGAHRPLGWKSRCGSRATTKGPGSFFPWLGSMGTTLPSPLTCTRDGESGQPSPPPSPPPVFHVLVEGPSRSIELHRSIESPIIFEIQTEFLENLKLTITNCPLKFFCSAI